MRRIGHSRLMRISAAPSPTERATHAAQRNTSALKIKPCSRIARYSQNIERSSDCFSASDTGLLPVLGEKLAQPLRPRRAEHFGRRPLLLDKPLVQEDHAIRHLARKAHLVRH